MSDQGIKRTNFERLVIARNYIKVLQQENEVLKALVLAEREEREAERASFIEARNHILKANPKERKELQKEQEVLKWKKISKTLREGIERLQAENKKLKLQFEMPRFNNKIIDYNGLEISDSSNLKKNPKTASIQIRQNIGMKSVVKKSISYKIQPGEREKAIEKAKQKIDQYFD